MSTNYFIYLGDNRQTILLFAGLRNPLYPHLPPPHGQYPNPYSMLPDQLAVW